MAVDMRIIDQNDLLLHNRRLLSGFISFPLFVILGSVKYTCQCCCILARMIFLCLLRCEVGGVSHNKITNTAHCVSMELQVIKENMRSDTH